MNTVSNIVCLFSSNNDSVSVKILLQLLLRQKKPEFYNVFCEKESCKYIFKPLLMYELLKQILFFRESISEFLIQISLTYVK